MRDNKTETHDSSSQMLRMSKRSSLTENPKMRPLSFLSDRHGERVSYNPYSLEFPYVLSFYLGEGVAPTTLVDDEQLETASAPPPLQRPTCVTAQADRQPPSINSSRIPVDEKSPESDEEPKSEYDGLSESDDATTPKLPFFPPSLSDNSGASTPKTLDIRVNSAEIRPDAEIGDVASLLLTSGDSWIQTSEPPSDVTVPAALCVQSEPKVVSTGLLFTKLSYYRLPATFPQRLMVGHDCARSLMGCVRLRIGGICCEADPLVIANVIFAATGVSPAGVDVFTGHKGCGSIWLRTSREAHRVRTVLNQRVWMGPCELGYALLAKSCDAGAYLEDALRAAAKKFGPLRFPTHMMTVDEWSLDPPRKAVKGKHAKAELPPANASDRQRSDCCVLSEM